MISLACLAILKGLIMIILVVLGIGLLLIFPIEIVFALKEKEKMVVHWVFISFLGVICLIELVGIVYVVSKFMGV